MDTGRFEVLDPVFSDGFAEEMIRLAERFGSYGMYGQSVIREGLGRGLAQRHDAAQNFVRTGGRFGRREPPEELAARTNYFRETYAYWNDVRLPGVERFMFDPELADAARRTSGRRIVRPAIVYANLLVPGQELALHTDVPEFRGANRTKDPEWLLVAMHHSGLFDRWRIHITTGVAYFHECRAGEFAFYPDGPLGPPRTVPVRHNTAVLLDTDSTFHGVDRVGGERGPFPKLRPGMRLTFEGKGTWRAGPGDEALARYRWGQIRFSVSWKAYCYADEAEQRMVEEHTDDLTREQILDALLRDLRERGRLGAALPDETQLALTMIDEYIHFPPPAGPGVESRTQSRADPQGPVALSRQ
jgi:hypothetical protein